MIKITVIVQFTGLDDSVLLSHLAEQCRIKLCHRSSHQLISPIAPKTTKQSNGFRLEFSTDTQELCALHLLHELRSDGAIARLKSDRWTEIDAKWMKLDCELQKDSLPPFKAEYDVLPGTLRILFLDNSYGLATAKPDSLHLLSSRGTPPITVSPSAASHYEGSVAPGHYTLIVPETYKFPSDSRAQLVNIESDKICSLYAISTPLPITTGTIQFQTVDQNGDPIEVPQDKIRLSLCGTGEQTPTPDGTGQYTLDTAAPGTYTLVLPEEFINSDSEITYKWSSGSRVQSRDIKAGETGVFDPAVYQGYVSLRWSVTDDRNRKVSGALIQVLNSTTGQIIGEAVTGDNGDVTIPLKQQATSSPDIDVLVYASGSPAGVALSKRRPYPPPKNSPLPENTPNTGGGEPLAQEGTAAPTRSPLVEPAQNQPTSPPESPAESTRGAVQEQPKA